MKHLLSITMLVFLLGGCSKVNQENFDKIRNGMTSADVRQILGEPTESDSISVGIVSGTRSVWRDGNTSIHINFLQDKVQMKSFDRIEAQ